MRATNGLNQITRAVSDTTDRSHQEIWTLATAAAAVAVSVAAARSLIWVVDAATDVNLWPTSSERAHR
jgi:hypothetical protein